MIVLYVIFRVVTGDRRLSCQYTLIRFRLSAGKLIMGAPLEFPDNSVSAGIPYRGPLSLVFLVSELGPNHTYAMQFVRQPSQFAYGAM